MIKSTLRAIDVWTNKLWDDMQAVPDDGVWVVCGPDWVLVDEHHHALVWSTEQDAVNAIGLIRSFK